MDRTSITGLLTDDDAASPVIGIVLMVAITVILAALIGAFVLGVGGEQAKAPQASLEYDYNRTAGEVDVVHEGGDDLDASALAVRETGSTDGVSIVAGTDTFTSGDLVAEGTYEPEETISVVWLDPGSDDASVVGSSKAPT